MILIADDRDGSGVLGTAQLLDRAGSGQAAADDHDAP
jgi:hypothetical protein